MNTGWTFREAYLHLNRDLEDGTKVVKFPISRGAKISDALNKLLPNIKYSNPSFDPKVTLTLSINQKGVEIHDGDNIVCYNKITFELLKVQEEAFKEIVITTAKLYGLDEVEFDKE